MEVSFLPEGALVVAENLQKKGTVRLATQLPSALVNKGVRVGTANFEFFFFFLQCFCSVKSEERERDRGRSECKWWNSYV